MKMKSFTSHVRFVPTKIEINGSLVDVGTISRSFADFFVIAVMQAQAEGNAPQLGAQTFR